MSLIRRLPFLVFMPGLLVVLSVEAATIAWTQSVTVVNPLATQTLDRLSATRERPLFTPSRRPPAPPSAAAPHRNEVLASPPIPPPAVVLLGIVLDDEGARAIVRAGSGKAIRLHIGEEIAGWKVVQIEQRRLVLSLADRSVVFTLFSGTHSKRGSISTRATVTPDRFAQSRSDH